MEWKQHLGWLLFWALGMSVFWGLNPDIREKTEWYTGSIAGALIWVMFEVFYWIIFGLIFVGDKIY